MKFGNTLFGIVVLGGAVLGANAQFADLPDCGTQCASQAAGATSSCSSGDLSCLCTNQGFQSAFTSCVYIGCPREDQSTSIGRLGLICAAAPQPGTTSSSASTPAPQTTSSTSSSRPTTPATTTSATGAQPTTTTSSATGAADTTISRATTVAGGTTIAGVVEGTRASTNSESTVVVVQTQVVGGTSGGSGAQATGETVFNNAAVGVRSGALVGIVGAVFVGVVGGLGL